MAPLAVRDLHQALSNLQVDSDSPRVARPKSDAEMGIKELAVLRLDVDMVAPPDAADLAQPYRAMYAGELTTGDHLRLPQLTRLDGPSVRAAIHRVLGVDLEAPGGSPSARASEARMHHVLASLEDAVSQIQLQAGFHQRG